MNLRTRIPVLVLLSAMSIGTLVQPGARAADGEVDFPADYEDGVHYATVPRGNIRQEFYTSREAIAAARQGQALPHGTVITMVDYRDGGIHRYVVMEKQEGWGEAFSADIRNGDWKYRVFNPDGSAQSTNTQRCMSCHKPEAEDDYVQTYDRMADTELE